MEDILVDCWVCICGGYTCGLLGVDLWGVLLWIILEYDVDCGIINGCGSPLSMHFQQNLIKNVLHNYGTWELLYMWGVIGSPHVGTVVHVGFNASISSSGKI